MLLDELKAKNIETLKDKDQVTRGILSVVITKCTLTQVELKAKGNLVTGYPDA